MMSPIKMWFACFLFMPGFAASQITVEPMAPTAYEAVRATLPYSMIKETYLPDRTSAAMTNNKITVNVVIAPVIGVPPPGLDLTVSMGSLPIGSYGVEFVKVSQGGVLIGPIASASFAVSARNNGGSLSPRWNYSDLWWNPNESGWGISMTQHSSDALFAVWYVYGSDNRATWYVVPGGRWLSDVVFEGSVYRTTGPYWQQSFDPAAVSRSNVGSAQIIFESKDVGQFKFTIDGVTTTKRIERQPF
jgi:hypothetical protein